MQKTSRALVAYEDTLSWGYGAEIAARIADQISSIWMPPYGGWRPWTCLSPTARTWKNAILPQTADLFQAMKELSEY